MTYVKTFEAYVADERILNLWNQVFDELDKTIKSFNPKKISDHNKVVKSLTNILSGIPNKDANSIAIIYGDYKSGNINRTSAIDKVASFLEKNRKTSESYLNEKSGEIYNPKRNKPKVFKPVDDEDLKKEFFNLVNTAYAKIGGHIKFKTPDDMFSDPKINYWEGIDLHGDNDFDVIMFGKKTKYGIKFSGVGHDGEKDSKRTYIAQRGKDLKKLGYYVEVSGMIANILIDSYNDPIVTDPKEIEKVIGKKIKFHGKHPDGKSPGNGWYTRDAHGGKLTKTLLGRPKV